MLVISSLFDYNQSNTQMLTKIIENIFRLDLFERFSFSKTTILTKKAYLNIISKITNYFISQGYGFSTFPKELQRILRKIQKWQFTESQEIYQICLGLIQEIQSSNLVLKAQGFNMGNN